MCKGFIRIPRRIYEERQWNVKRVYSELDAFYDIYAAAYTRDRTEADGTKMKRNQLSVSYRALADKWIWAKSKVERFLSSLAKKGYISIETTKHGTIVTIIDFGQDSEKKDETSSGTQGGTPSGTPLGHPNPYKQMGSDVVSGTQGGTPSGTQGGTLSRAYKNDNIISCLNEEEKNNKKPPLSPKGKDDYDWSLVSSEMKPVIEKWIKYKREKKQTYKPSGFASFCKKLMELSEGDTDKANKIVEQSMANNWAGVFELKDNRQLPIGFNIDNSKDKYEEKGW